MEQTTVKDIALYYFRSTTFVRDYLTKYLAYIFYAQNEGYIQIQDGSKNFTWSGNRAPHVLKIQSWDFRNLPCVLIGNASGSYKKISFTKDMINEPSPTETSQYKEYGGDIPITVDIETRATTTEERDRLTDVVGLFLAHPAAKDYFYQQGLTLPEDPMIRGSGVLREPAIDHPIYSGGLSIAVTGVWRAREDLAERLIDVIVSISAELDL